MLATLLAIIVLSASASGATLRSPRHGQEIEARSPETSAPTGGGMRVVFRDGGTPLLVQGGDRGATQTCHESAGTPRRDIAPGKRATGHRSNSHLQMREYLRNCVARALAAD